MSNKWLANKKFEKKRTITRLLANYNRAKSFVISDNVEEIQEEGVVVYELSFQCSQTNLSSVVYAEGDMFKTNEEFTAAELNGDLVEIKLFRPPSVNHCYGFTRNVYSDYLNSGKEKWNYNEWFKEFCSVAKKYDLNTFEFLFQHQEVWENWRKYYDAGYSPACALSSFLGE